MFSLEYLRSFRIGPFTIFDTVGSYVGVLILSPILIWLASRLRLHIPLSSWLWFTLPLAVLFHVIFQQSTPLMKILTNPVRYEFYIAVIILVAMTYMGFRKVSRVG